MTNLKENLNPQSEKRRIEILNNMLRVLSWEHCKIGFKDKENYEQKRTVLFSEHRKLARYLNNPLLFKEIKEKIKVLGEWEDRKDLNYNLSLKKEQEKELKGIVCQL